MPPKSPSSSRLWGGKGKAEPSGEDGLIALALADAAVKSVAEGRVVKMSEIL